MRPLRTSVIRASVFLAAAWAIGAIAETASAAGGFGAGGGSDIEPGQSGHLIMMLVYGSVALIFSFLCSVAEAVVLSLSPSYIANLEKEGREKIAALLGRIKNDIDRSLAAILTLNTVAHTVGAGGAGAEAAAYFGDKYVGIAMAVLTLLILFLSEIIPKTLGALYWRTLAPATGHFVQWLIRLLYPFILISELLTKWLARGKNPHEFNRDEFAAMVDIGAKAGQLGDTESRILNNLFRFPDLCAEDIMTPRTVVFALQEDQTVNEVLKTHADMHFSRIPVYGENRDEVTGFVLKTDLLLTEHDKRGETHLRELKRDIRTTHERTQLSKILEDVLENRAHILLVVDDFGGMEGIVTLEDVVETLVGIEIVDEADTIDDMRRLARQKWEERMQSVGIDVRTPHSDDESTSTEGVDN